MASRKRPVSSTVSLGGRRTYVAEFIVVVTAYALKHGVQEAAAYYDVPTRTISKWVKEARDMNELDLEKALSKTNNPFRDTQYNIQRRMALSDKLFSELEMSIEAERLKNGGYIPAPMVSKLASAFATLVDKRRLEEGAHTALVQEAKEPEAILTEGEARVVEFKRRFGLPSGEEEEAEGSRDLAALPDRPRRKKTARG